MPPGDAATGRGSGSPSRGAWPGAASQAVVGGNRAIRRHPRIARAVGLETGSDAALGALIAQVGFDRLRSGLTGSGRL